MNFLQHEQKIFFVNIIASIDFNQNIDFMSKHCCYLLVYLSFLLEHFMFHFSVDCTFSVISSYHNHPLSNGSYPIHVGCPTK